MTPKNSAKTVRIVAYGFIGFAIVWGLAPYQGINAPARILLDILDWPFGDAPATLTGSEMWLSSIGAGLVAAISIMLIGIVAPAIEKLERKTVQATKLAFTTWYIIDGVGSATSGVPSNIFFNTILLIAILAPLYLVDFEKAR